MSGTDTEAADAAEAAADALATARAFYGTEKLRLPPLPRALAARLAQWEETEWGLAAATGEANDGRRDLTDRSGFLETATNPAAPDDVAFGYVGHGVSSWWLCYQIVSGPIALFIRQGYGGPYRDSDSARRTIDGLYRDAAVLIVMADAAAAEGIIPEGQRLIVAVDDRDKPFWGLSGDPDHWEGTEDPIAAAEAFLQA